MSSAATLEGLPPLGSVLAAKYELVRVLGRGGMGVVVQARHLRMEKDVALKILLPALRDQPEVVARFEREGRAAAALRGEHVARVLDVDTLDDGAPFIVMELLRGEDLAEILHKRGKLAVPDAVGYLLEACTAMAEAHRMGIVHRDLKPNNLFVDKQGERPILKVLDFGISKVAGDVAASVTATATAFGTPLYMSPEQVRSAKNVDARADIWSLGVVLYELLTGISPFAADSATGILAAIIADTPVPVADRRPDLPRALADVVMRALEKDPAARFSDVETFAAALLPFSREGHGVAAGEPQGAQALASQIPGPVTMGGTPKASAEPVAPAATHVPPRTTGPRPTTGGLPVVPIAMGMLLAVAASAFLFMAVGKRRLAQPPARPEPTTQAAPPTPAPVVAPVPPVATATAVESVTATPAPPAPPASAVPRPTAAPRSTASHPAGTPGEKPTAKPEATPPRPPPPDPNYL